MDQTEKAKEPFSPENTPVPPQVMDPRKDPNRDEELSDESNSTTPAGDASDRPRKEKKPGETETGEKEGEHKKGGKLLGESDSQIDDETTI